MNNSIVFLGKFDQKMLPIETTVINISKRYKIQKKSIKYNQGEMPDVVKYTIDDYECDVWIPLGDVKPTLLLKDLLSKSKIIFFVFYFSNHETLDYLKDEWGPIIKKVDECLKDKQERILIGINSESSLNNQRKIEDLISSTMSYLNCNCFYEECTLSKLLISKTIGSFTVINDLINYIKPIITIQTSKNEDKKTELNERKRTLQVNEITMGDKLLNLTKKEECNEQKEKEPRILNKKLIKQNENSNIMISDKLLKLTEEERNGEQKEKELIEQNENNSIMISDKLLKLTEEESDNNVEKDATINNICYKISDKFQSAKIIIFELKNSKKDVNIPSHIKFKDREYEITEICDKAFANSTIESLSFSEDSKLNKIGNCAFENSKVKSLSISNNVKFCDFCFKNCKNLSTISINNVSFIETSDNCFAGCDSLSKIIIKSKSPLLRISKGNFNGIKNLDIIEIEAQNLIIEDNCFKDCFVTHKTKSTSNYYYNQKPKSISMKISSKIDIENNCFNNLKILESICIKAENISIKNGCFNEIKNLKNLNFECKQIKIGENCFKNSINNNNNQPDDNLVSEYNIVQNYNSNKILIKSQSEIEIGDFSFYGQNLVDLVEMTSKNINIGKECFNKCQFLTKIKITSTSLIKIFENSFLDLIILEEIILNSNQIMIKDNCFHNSSLINKEKYSTLRTNKSSYNRNNSIKADSDIEIGDFCFHELNIQNSIEIIAKNIKIGEKFISDCNYLTNVNMKTNSALDILKNSFCNLILLGKVVIESEKLKIDNDCFNNCFINENRKICTITIKSDSDVEIRKHCFNLCNLDSVDITGKNFIIKDCCFKKCESLKSFKILCPEKIIFGSNELNECINLKKLYLKSTIIYLDKECFSTNKNKLEVIEIECSEVTIEENCFKENASISTIQIKRTNSINIHNYAFAYCQKLTSLRLESIKISLGQYCFQNCSSLNSICFPEYIYNGTKIINHLSENLIIEEGCFMNCQKLLSFELKAVKNIVFKPKSFEKCENLNKFSIINGNKYTIDNEILISNPKLAMIEFKGEEIHFSNSISYFCSSLAKINIEANNPIKITKLTFTECKSITDIILSSKSTIDIAQESFKELYALNLVNLNSKEITIGERCFGNCTNLKQITINSRSSLTLLTECFKGLTKLESIKIISKFVSINDKCFINSFSAMSKSNKYLRIEAETLILGDSCFRNCQYLSSIYFNNLKSIILGQNAFENCISMDRFYLTSTSINVKNGCFSGCTKLVSISFNCDELTIGDKCFNNCISLSSLYFNGIKTAHIGTNVFIGCEKISSLTLRVLQKLTLNDECFSFAKNLKTIEIEANEIDVGSFIFKNCDSLNRAVFKYSTNHNICEVEFKECNPQIKYEIVQIKK